MARQNLPYFLKGSKELVPRVFETAYGSIFDPNKRKSFKSLEDWKKKLVQIGLTIDLSQVRWIDFGSAAQLILLIEWAQKNNIKVSVLLPLTRLSQGEQKHLVDLENGDPTILSEKRKLFEAFAKGRTNAFKYLELIGFLEAAECQHLQGKSVKVSFNFDYDFQSDTNKNQKQARNVSRIKMNIEDIERTSINPIEIGYKRLIPLTWIDKFGKSASQDKEDFENYETLINRILSNAEQGLEHIDAKTISNVILHELTKNLAEHAKSSHALIGGVLQTTNVLNSDSFSDCEKEYFDWFKTLKSHYISIFFGDTGLGLVTTLKGAVKIPKFVTKDKDFIHWSFDKWSTCKKDEKIRGTKGLYRVLRIIKKYDGLVTIRTSDVIAGFQKGGKLESTEISTTEKHAFFPGTFIRLHLVPFKEMIKININPNYKQADSIINKYYWVTSFESITTIGKTPFEQAYVRDIILEAQSKNRENRIINLLLILQIDTKEISSAEKQKEILNNVFMTLSLTRHPGAIVLYLIGKPLNLPWDFIEGEIRSLNSIIKLDKESKETSDLNSEIVYDPVLVLGENRQFGWVGVESEEILNLLTDIYKSNSNILSINNLAKLNQFDKENLTKIKQFFSGDEALAYINQNNEIILRFNFLDLREHYLEKLELFVKESRDFSSTDFYLTPNLKVIHNWIDIKKDILKDEGEITGFAIALSTLLKENLSELSKIFKIFKILIDNQDCFELAAEFAQFNGIPKYKIIKLYEEVDGRLTRRNAIFEKEDKVIILTTIISTQETIIRSIKTILRDHATPVVIISLVRNKQEGLISNEISVWGSNIQIISLYNSISVTGKYNESEPNYYIEPFSFNKIRIYENDKLDEKNKLNLPPYNLINEYKALHFNHVGSENGRHFTFYLSAKRLLKEIEDRNSVTTQFILNRYIEVIDNWINTEEIQDFEIWKIALEIKYSHPVIIISSKIKDHYGSKCKTIIDIQRYGSFGEMKFSLPANYKNISKSKNVLFIDWGTMTGTTIQQVLNLAPGPEKKNVLCSILFNQLPSDEHLFLSKLSLISDIIEKPEDGQAEISFFNEPKQIKQTVSKTEVRIKFLYDLPLFYYEQVECPICEHRQLLRDFDISSVYMDDFFKKRKEILKIKERNITDEEPVDFYGLGENHRINSIQIWMMFEFKVLLKRALTSTFYRNEVKNRIFKITNQEKNELDKEKRDINSELYAIIYFLSVEIMWMQKPPLSFHILREEITKMALAIAVWNSKEMKYYLSTKDDIIIRYKFAAISVLRSTNKEQFINNIVNIFRSSYLADQVSRSLSQNLFYHIHSYLIRDYHKSEKLFNTIIENLTLLTKSNINDANIENTIRYLIFIAERRKSANRVPNFVVDVFKSLKRERENNFDKKEKHNDIIESYLDIYPKYDLQINKVIKGESTDISFLTSEVFINWKNRVIDKWSYVALYLNNVIVEHLAKIKDILKSTIFQTDNPVIDEIKQYFPPNICIGNHDKFTEILKQVVENPSRLLNETYYNQYLYYYYWFYNNILKYDKENLNENSVLNKCLEMIPVNLSPLLWNCCKEFILAGENQHIIININFYPSKDYFTNNATKIFFPNVLFERYIKHIFNNILKRWDKINIINIDITIINTVNKEGKEILKLRFENTSTIYNGKKINGGLEQSRVELHLFNGDLEYQLKDNNNFFVEITLLTY